MIGSLGRLLADVYRLHGYRVPLLVGFTFLNEIGRAHV